MNLRKIQSKWISKFEEMQKSLDGTRLAAPFFSVPGRPGNRTKSGTILLVGKSTAGNWKLEQFQSLMNRPLSERLDERRAATKQHLDFMQEQRTSAFWRFWKSLGMIGSPVIWTNLAKIGLKVGNPMGPYLSMQRDLACETLTAELNEYKPSLVVIAADYAKCEVVFPVFGEQGAWKQRRDGVCWINGSAAKPAVLWTDHPQGKKREILRSWLEKAQELVSQRS
jgi:hypothetical protein